MASEPSFEEALAQLETLVAALEGGDLPLEEALRLFEEGVRLTRLCTARLEDAERRVHLLTRGPDGGLREVPLLAPDGEDVHG
jgi:exodeoxyribonuclease VII small subunit